MQVTIHTGEGIHPVFETKCRCNQKSKNRGTRGSTKRTNILQFFGEKYSEYLLVTLIGPDVKVGTDPPFVEYKGAHVNIGF